MRFGAVFPSTEIPAVPEEIARWATGAEQYGVDHLVLNDHVVGVGPVGRPGRNGYTSQDKFHEIFVLLGYLAGLTTSVELVTAVAVLPQRQPVLVAKQAAEVDVLSGGRLRLGVGVGSNPVEYEALGEEFSDRGPAFPSRSGCCARCGPTRS